MDPGFDHRLEVVVRFFFWEGGSGDNILSGVIYNSSAIVKCFTKLLHNREIVGLLTASGLRNKWI